MSLTTKRRLPNINNQKHRLLIPVSINTENNTYQSLEPTRSPLKSNGYKNRKLTPTKQQQDSIIEEILHPHSDRRFQEIKRKLISDEETRILQGHAQSNKDKYQSETKIRTQQNSTTLRESTRSIRESVTQFKNELMRNEIPKDEELSLLLNHRRRTDQDHRQQENEYLLHQQTILSKSATLNEMLSFKKEMEKSEHKYEQLSEQLESVMKSSYEKDKLLSKTLFELKEMTENSDTFERQNNKLQHDLTLALEKLEEMTEEAERFARESFNSQKQLADSEQKREEFQIQAQETIKQWNARVKKLEKDIDRYKLDSTQITEKNEQLIKEIDTLKSQNLNGKEQLIKVQNDFNDANANYKRLEEQFKQNENKIIQLRSTNSYQEAEISTLKRTVHELENQFSTSRQRLSQLDKDKQHLQGLLQEEIKQRDNLHSKQKQSEHDLQSINTSFSQLQNERIDLLQKLKELQLERNSLLQEKAKYRSLENDYEEIKKKLETTKSDYTRGMKALQMDYETKIETCQLQLSEEKTQNSILQRHEVEYKQEVEKLREKVMKYEEENTEGQYTIETLSREMNEKIQLIEELESKITKLLTEVTNQRNEIIKKDKDYQNSLDLLYNDITYCTQCLSTDSNKPFVIEPATTPRDDIEHYSSQFKAHLAWLKQELEMRHELETKLRQDLNNALNECETDRQYFASEIAKREMMIDELTKNYQSFERETANTIYSYDQKQLFGEDDKYHIDHGYRQFQVMIDSVKRELYTAKIQLLS